MGLFRRRAKRKQELAQPAGPPPAPRASSSAALLRPSHVAVRVLVRRRGTERGVPGAEVLLAPTTDWGAGHQGATTANAATDGEGVARFLVPPGAYAVTIREAGHATRARIEVAGRALFALDVAAPPAGEEALVVRVRRGGVPARGEKVRVLEGPAFAQATTGEDGSCVLHLVPGRYRIAAAGEEVELAHEGAQSIVVAVGGMPDEAWELAEAEELPFAVARPRATARAPEEPRARPPLLATPTGERYVAEPTAGTASARVRVE